MYSYIYTHADIYSYIHMLMHTYTYTYIYSYIHILIHTYTPAYICSYIHMLIHIYANTFSYLKEVRIRPPRMDLEVVLFFPLWAL